VAATFNENRVVEAAKNMHTNFFSSTDLVLLVHVAAQAHQLALGRGLHLRFVFLL